MSSGTTEEAAADDASTMSDGLLSFHRKRGVVELVEVKKDWEGNNDFWGRGDGKRREVGVVVIRGDMIFAIVSSLSGSRKSGFFVTELWFLYNFITLSDMPNLIFLYEWR